LARSFLLKTVGRKSHNKTTHMLAHYAEYANIGGNKTAAYGQTKLPPIVE
jgi:hypothetical protein